MFKRAPLGWLTLKGLACRYYYRGQPSDHFDGKQFHDLPPMPKRAPGAMKKWKRERKANPVVWQWQALPASTFDKAKAPASDEVRVTFVNHSTFLVQLNGLNILTDPVWSKRVSPFTFAGPKRYHSPGIDLDELPPIDAIWLSHNHYDHCDVWALRQLAKRFPEVHLYTGLGNGKLCREAGISKVTELDWWESTTLAGHRLTYVSARHWGARSIWDRRRTLWGGFVYESRLGPVYFAGDTGHGEFFAELREKFGPISVALLPIGAYRPEWFMHPVHMGPEEAVGVHQVLEARLSIACHFGCFALADDQQFEPQQQLAESLKQAGISDEVFRTPVPGQPLTWQRETNQSSC